MHVVATLIEIFNQQFCHSHGTCLVGGGEEPIYLPPDSQCPLGQIVFTRDYFASALHEVAHWCLAGSRRRQRVDYGYWYTPDGRTPEQQRVFERVEIRPQALEWISAMACGHPFHVSADNLALHGRISDQFRQNIAIQAQRYCIEGLPRRAEQWVRALVCYWGMGDVLNPEHYGYRDLL